jgi:hypothetical protein
VFQPDTGWFNAMSAGIDATNRVGFDPLNVPANELTLAWRNANAIIPVDKIGEAGLVSGRRPWIHAKTADQWFTTGRGTRMVDALVDERTINGMNKLVGDLPIDTQRALRMATDRESIQNIIKPLLGTTKAKQAPTLGTRRVLGNVIYNRTGLNRLGPDNMIGRQVRRLKAASGNRVLSPYDANGSMKVMRAHMETMGASADDIERVLLKVAMSEGNPRKLNQAYAEMIEVMSKRLDDLGYNAEDGRWIMEQFMQEQFDNQVYFQSLAGNPMTLEGADMYTVIGPGGDEIEVAIAGAHLDSEMAEQMLVMPNLRDTRRATDPTRAKFNLIRERMGWDPKGIEATWMAGKMDKMQSVWRNFALLRGGWALRVIPEEALRMTASGYGDMVGNPAQAIVWTLLNPEVSDVMGDSLNSYFKTQGLGASGFHRSFANEALGGTRFDRSRTGWGAVPTVNKLGQWTNGGRVGIATEYVQLWGSEAGRRVAANGVDDTYDFFRATDEGKAIIDEIVKKSGGGPTAKLHNSESLRRWLESVDARIAGMSGGDYIYRKAGTRQWLDSFDQPFDNPMEWDTARVNRELTSRGVDPGMDVGLGGRRLSLDERRARLLEEMGLPNMDELGNRQYIVIKNGSDEGRAIIAGMDPSEVAAGRKVAGQPQLDQLTAVRDDINDLAARYPDELTGYGSDMDRARARIIEAHWDELNPETQRWLEFESTWTEFETVEEFGSTGRGLHPEDQQIHGSHLFNLENQIDEIGLSAVDEIAPQGNPALRIHGEMNRQEYMALENALPSIFSEAYPPPAHVKGANPRLTGRLNGQYDRFVDALFSGIMEQNTMRFVRSPYARLRYAEEMAHFSVWSDDVTRGRLLAWAKENGLLDEFKKAQKTRVKELGLRRLPKMQSGRQAAIDDFNRLQERVIGAEKVSDPADWSKAERAAYDSGNYEEFSRLRGYTKAEIDEWKQYQSYLKGTDPDLVQLHPDQGEGVSAEVLWDQGRLPMGPDEPFTSLDEIDQLAKAKAISDSKRLFYDLAEKNNVADMMRFAAPFADAWWEVVTRWANLLGGGSIAGPGQAVRNWERLRQVGQETQRQIDRGGGFFDEDEFGNRVFKFPGAGMLTSALADQHKLFQGQIGIDQMLFVDPNVRSIFLPGASPFVQVTGMVLQPLIKKVLGLKVQDSINTVVYGDYAPRDIGKGEGLLDTFMPTWMRRGLDAALDERHEVVYADEMMGAYSSLLQDPTSGYSDDTEALSNALVRKAQEIGTWLGWLRIIDAFMMPASPQYRPGFFVDVEGAENPQFWIDSASIADDWRIAQELYGDEDEARQFLFDRYGYDPLNFGGSTRFIKDRPTTFEGLDWLNEHAGMRDHFDYSLMFFVPENDLDEFFQMAWNQQFDEEAREDLTVKEYAQGLNRNKGRIAHDQLIEVYDEQIYQGELALSKGSKAMASFRNDMDQWKYNQLQNLSLQYFAWGADRTIAGVTQRPTYDMVFDEIMAASIKNGNVGSPAARLAVQETTPHLLQFLDYVATRVDQLEQAGLEQANSVDWWRTHSPNASYGMRRFKRDLHKWLLDDLEDNIARLDPVEDLDTIRAANWYLQSVLVPLIEQVEYEQDFVDYPSIGPPPVPGEKGYDLYQRELEEQELNQVPDVIEGVPEVIEGEGSLE